MAYKFTLADLKRSPVKNISGVCVDSPEFLDLANEAQERLLQRGNWWDTEWLVRLCIYNRCITWPRYVSTPLGMRFCDGTQAIMQNRWFNIVGPWATYQNASSQIGYPNSLGAAYSQYAGFMGWAPNVWAADGDTAPCYNEITAPEGRLIRYYVKNTSDIGKKIRLFGTQFGGQPLQTQISPGVWEDGLVLTAAAPFASTSIYVTKIPSVIREPTSGMSYLYAYDPVADNMVDLAAYEPGETNPRYRRTSIDNYCAIPGCKDDYERRKVCVEALVKLAFIPLRVDTDFLIIDNFTAMKLMVQAIRLEEAGDPAGAEAYILKAVKELNLEDRNKNPNQQTTVSVNPLSTNRRSVYSPY